MAHWQTDLGAPSSTFRLTNGAVRVRLMAQKVGGRPVGR